jgi:hypothetical protein
LHYVTVNQSFVPELMSIPHNRIKSDNDEGHQSDDIDTSVDGADRQGSNHDNISGVRFPPGFYYNSDAQRSDAATVCSGSIHEDFEVESVLSIQEDIQNLMTSSSSALTTLPISEQNAEHGTTDANASNPPSLSNTSTERYPTLNRSLLMKQDRERLYDHNRRDFHLGNDGGDVPNELLHERSHRHSNTYSRGPSSVKSYGSNAGSDDCGGSLDVETHSVGARSTYSQEDTMPVAMPDPDPEVVAVAALSINPVDSNSICHDSQYMNLTLQRFHRNQSRSDHFNEARNEQAGNSTNSYQLAHSRDEDSHRISSDWNDPRTDDQYFATFRRERLKQSQRPSPRSRSRSRSPST